MFSLALEVFALMGVSLSLNLTLVWFGILDVS